MSSPCLSLAMSAAPALLPWFAIRVKSRRENVTAIALRGKGLEEFAPTCRARNRWSDRVKEVDVPLFPGYIFCRFDPQHRLPVMTTPGIVSIVGLGKTPVPVDDSEIARIQSVVSSGALAYPWPFLCIGQKVTIRRGPLTGVEGFLIASKDQYRLVVSVQLLQRSVATEIDRDCVEASC
jgi:transcriptional antiterminator NusG